MKKSDVKTGGLYRFRPDPQFVVMAYGKQPEDLGSFRAIVLQGDADMAAGYKDKNWHIASFELCPGTVQIVEVITDTYVRELALEMMSPDMVASIKPEPVNDEHGH